ncbi:large subunit GTPase 1 [Pancytospora philotis]|nr:large subunit GTPase 1 [Pancytospora philotis]
MAAKKSKQRLMGSMLVADRFSGCTAPKVPVQRGSVTEYSGISRLGENLAMENKTISMPGDEAAGLGVEGKYGDLIEGLNYGLSIPPRVPYDCVEKGEYRELESFVFNHWKLTHRDKVFERNIELWRQFWIACERADVIAQIVDARDPHFFINADIFAMYPNKRHLILCNKSDLVGEHGPKLDSRIMGVPVHCYSTKDKSFAYPLTGMVCLVGYPNVGKSSTINLILQQKKVKASATPGKTKYIQTIETPDFTMLDCPGLVFPRHDKIELALNGILNIDQIPELDSYAKHILDTIGRQRIAAFYKVTPRADDFLGSMAVEKGWLKSKCLRYIVKDYAAGLMCFT